MYFSPGQIKPTVIIKPQIDITLGQNVSITCSVPDGQVGGTFVFNRTKDTFSENIESNGNSATFYIPRIGFEHEGEYQCQFKIRAFNKDFGTDLSNPVPLYLNGNAFLFSLLLHY